MKGTVIPLAGKEGTVVKHPRGCPTAAAATAATVFNVESGNNNSNDDNNSNNSNDNRNNGNSSNVKRGSLTLPSEPN